MTKLRSLVSPAQGTTVRVITAIDQDKGRPRGIGYTIVSGKALGRGLSGRRREEPGRRRGACHRG